MKLITKVALGSIAFASLSLAFVACSDTPVYTPPVDAGPDAKKPDTSTPPDAGTDAFDAADTSDSALPTPPLFGTPIDRLGRPAINTALNHAFDPDSGAAGTAKDKYNADDNDGGSWFSWMPEFQANQAIYDGLDYCGNAFLYFDAGPDSGDAGDAGPLNPYSVLAGVLADDRLYTDTSQTSCSQYLAIERTAVGIFAAPNDCGGRSLQFDVIDTTYSLLVQGQLIGPFRDGIMGDPAKVSGNGNDPDASAFVFPYLVPAK